MFHEKAGPKNYHNSRAGEAPVEWSRCETRVLKVVGSNPCTVYWLDIFSHN